MALRERVSQGIQAGLLAGIAVALFFFVADLVRLAPLATPSALQRTFIGPGGTVMDFPIIAQVAAGVSFLARLLVFTVIHLLTFAGLGAAAGLLLCGRRFRACAASGACYGAVVCSIVFYASLVLAGGWMVADVPGLPSVLAANLVAGLVMGTYLGLGSKAA